MTSISRFTARPSALRARVRARQAFDERELLVVVSKFRAAGNQPAVALPQPLQTIQVAPPGLVVDELPMLWRGIFGGPRERIPPGQVQTTRGASQLVTDPVLDGTPEVGAQRVGVSRLE